MSDRQRRWICRLIFLVACLLPTGWFYARFALQPNQQTWSKELELALGLPLQVANVSTPNPSQIRLQHLQWTHPELGRIARIDQIDIRQTDVQGTEFRKWFQASVLQQQRWHIHRMEVSESALPQLLETLHQQWFRRHRTSALPEIQIDDLLVFPDLEFDSLDADAHRPSLRLTNLKVHRSAETENSVTLRLLVEGQVLPRIRGPIVNMQESPEQTIPFEVLLDRELKEGMYSTQCFLKVQRPLPFKYLGLAGVPKILVQHNFRFSGKFLGWVNDHDWGILVTEAHLWGDPATHPSGQFELRDLVDWIQPPVTDQEIPLQGAAQLMVSEAKLQSRWNNTPRLLSLDAQLSAQNGVLSKTFLANLKEALCYESLTPNPIAPYVRFQQLGVRMLANESHLELHPLESAQHHALIIAEQQVLLQATDTPLPLSRFYQAKQPGAGPFENLANLMPAVTATPWATDLKSSPVRQALYEQPSDHFMQGNMLESEAATPTISQQ